ncbi:MAG TPA: nucleotidyl transferase AbiEii/AbiGii toxin family protein [Phycisphaerales bacterium]|nr:nucleotidyl transferase AbiEii/AbiGii toxin family protein [Phycisphaerales bacterium]
MKDYLKQQIGKIQDTNLARCIVREYLQARTLECLQENGAFVNWAFVGGTALRFLYSMPRFSEDMDFSITETSEEDNFEELMKKVKNRFLAEDYGVTVKAKTAKTVRAAFIKFPGLLYELGLSPLSSEVISIKVEIDSNPPAGAKLETSIVRKHCLLNLQHYDKSSLLAGKLHALTTRKYTKGRDVYDLMWYLSDRTWPEPNILLLNNALKQTAWSGAELTEENWRQQIAKRVSEFDWNKVIADVKPFIEKQSDLQMLTPQNLIKLLKDTAQ